MCKVLPLCFSPITCILRHAYVEKIPGSPCDTYSHSGRAWELFFPFHQRRLVSFRVAVNFFTSLLLRNMCLLYMFINEGVGALSTFIHERAPKYVYIVTFCVSEPSALYLCCC